MADVLKPTEVDNLVFIPAGPAPPNPAELLNSQAYNNLLQQLRRDFQHLILDTPPTLGFADARVLALQADGVLLVAKHQTTPKEAGKLVRQQFSQINAKMLGMVLNQVGTRDLRRYAYYHKFYEHYYADQPAETCALEHQDDFPSIHVN
jgi:capsular exopolysaccharide synthesis family protein